MQVTGTHTVYGFYGELMRLGLLQNVQITKQPDANEFQIVYELDDSCDPGFAQLNRVYESLGRDRMREALECLRRGGSITADMVAHAQLVEANVEEVVGLSPSKKEADLILNQTALIIEEQREYGSGRSYLYRDGEKFTRLYAYYRRRWSSRFARDITDLLPTEFKVLLEGDPHERYVQRRVVRGTDNPSVGLLFHMLDKLGGNGRKLKRLYETLKRTHDVRNVSAFLINQGLSGK